MRHRSDLLSSLVPIVLFLCVACMLFTSCASAPSAEESLADSLNVCAHNYRYSCIDSTLSCAKRALKASGYYAAGRAFALNNLAFVAYQQMRYDTAIRYLDQIYRECHNQVELLCADVMYMKVAQRTGQGLVFFKHRNAAFNRINRLTEDDGLLTPAQQKRLRYARSELHIISCTYYYYYGQTRQAVEEIQSTHADPDLPSDTIQWVNYRYMLGSGGLLQGTPLDIALNEFDHLFASYNTSRSVGLTYFQANALQSMAALLDNPEVIAYISQQRPNAIVYLQNQHESWHALPTIDAYAQLSLTMADHALHLFRDYKDLFQLACAYRTVGEIYYRHGMYSYALHQFTHALELVESQKQRSHWQVPFWTFSIEEYLSLTYSALGDKHNSDFHRNIYLDNLEQCTQDYELEERKLQLEQELKHTRTSLVFLVLLILLSMFLFWLLIRRMRSQSQQVADSISRFDRSAEWLRFVAQTDETAATLTDRLQELQEELHLHRMHIRDYRHGNVERRAKVSLVYAIIPYLDRIIAEVNRMQKDGRPDDARLCYVSELAAEIMKINAVLTDWIQMRQGQLKLHVTTFPIQQVFDIISGSRIQFDRQGISLSVEPSACLVKADMALTLFMINTLCDNARKFTPSGGKVTVRAVSCADGVEVSVCDTGQGLSPADVDVLNTSKVYDPSQLGGGAVNKGFGFGIMNCKGIIAKYRKTSDKFRMCAFGVESSLGQGSRFWFRLPGAMCLLLFVLCFSSAAHAADSLRAKCDTICQANIDGNYEEAYAYGEQALSLMHEPVDTPSVIYILNEMAISSLALRQWDNYHRCNKECVRLHSLYTADNSLPAYCRQMERMKHNNVFVYALLVLFAVLALVLFYLLMLRGLLRRDSYAHALNDWLLQRIAEATTLMAAYADQCHRQDWSRLLHAFPDWVENAPEAMSASCTACVSRMHDHFLAADKTVEQIEALTDTNHRTQFEEDRLYVMNQVLDNCLSTIKHETMYYPARTKLLVEHMRQHTDAPEQTETLEELSELVHFYRDIYVLLYQQAERQMEQKHFFRETLLLSDFDNVLPALSVTADRLLLNLLLDMLHKAEDVEPEREAGVEAAFVFVRFTYPGCMHTEQELANWFQPATARIPFLVAKQIIRENDANCAHVGLRLFAEPGPEGYSICFTLPLATI